MSTSFVFNPTIREGPADADDVVYADIQNYLNAIANKANNPIGDSPHGAWWLAPDGTSPLSYNDFLTGQMPNLDSVNIMDSGTPLQSAFYVILTNPNGYQGNRNQMPDGGPYITDAGYTATLPDGTTISGAQIAGEHRVVALERLPREVAAEPRGGRPDPKEDTTRRTQDEWPSACRRAGAADPGAG